MQSPTLRRNGRHEITVRVAHHLDGGTIADILTRAISAGYEIRNRDDVDRIVRERLLEVGDDARATSGNPSDYYLAVDDIERAIGFVRQFWPEMDDDSLDEFVTRAAPFVPDDEADSQDRAFLPRT